MTFLGEQSIYRRVSGPLMINGQRTRQVAEKRSIVREVDRIAEDDIGDPQSLRTLTRLPHHRGRDVYIEYRAGRPRPRRELKSRGTAPAYHVDDSLTGKHALWLRRRAVAIPVKHSLMRVDPTLAESIPKFDLFFVGVVHGLTARRRLSS